MRRPLSVPPTPPWCARACAFSCTGSLRSPMAQLQANMWAGRGRLLGALALCVLRRTCRC